MIYLPILTYHRVLPDGSAAAQDPKRIAVTQSQFRKHLAMLYGLGYQTLRLDEYAKRLGARQAADRKSVAISFDDGYEDVLTLALPILQEFRFTATIFAVSGQLAGRNAWDNGHAKLLTAEQYRTLDRAGLAIGAHTASHVHLPQVDRETARREIQDSKKQLDDLLGKPVTTFAYPYGETNPDIEALVREAGFEAAYATDRAPRDHASNLFRIRRVVIFPRTNSWELLWKVQRWYPWYQDWKR